jgi:hypothetical protein
MGQYRLPRATVPLTLGIVIGLALASTPLFIASKTSHSIQSPGLGVTSQEAYNQTEAKLGGLPGSPWGLISMESVIATAPAAPFETDQDSCQTIPGPTIWNLSRASDLNTSLWGGRSVFWQFVYINDTYAMIFASDISGSIVVDGPYNANSPCVSSLENGFGGLFTSGFPPSYWLPGSTFDQELLQTLAQLNSSAWAPTAASNFGNNSSKAWGDGIVTFYTLGTTWLNLVGWTEGGWLVWYWACGIPGRSGEQPFAEAGWALNSSPRKMYGVENGSTSCPVNTNVNYNVTFDQTSSPATGLGSSLAEHLTIGLGSAGTYIYWDTANSLVSWMTHVSLNAGGGAPVASTAEECPTNATSVTECVAPAQGWYAALLSPDGYLMDAFPTTSGGSRWQFPNVFVTNNDTLVILSSASLVESGDVLSIAPAYSFPQVLGNVTL